MTKKTNTNKTQSRKTIVRDQNSLTRERQPSRSQFNEVVKGAKPSEEAPPLKKRK